MTVNHAQGISAFDGEGGDGPVSRGLGSAKCQQRLFAFCSFVCMYDACMHARMLLVWLLSCTQVQVLLLLLLLLPRRLLLLLLLRQILVFLLVTD